MTRIFLVTKDNRVELTSHPFKVVKEVDLSGLQADIRMADTGRDGSLFLSTKYHPRDVEIEGVLLTNGISDRQVEERRKELFEICNPKNELTLEIQTAEESYFLYTYPAAFPVFLTGHDGKNKHFQRFMLQLTAPDPYLYKNKKVVEYASVQQLFSFPIQFNDVVMGEERKTQVETIYNSGTAEAPIEIHMRSKGRVENPNILNIYTQKQIRLNTVMLKDDEIYITTGRKKEIYRIRNGIKEPLYYSLDLSSDFLQLNAGENVLRFGTTSGIDSLEVKISYQERVGGI